MSDGIEQIRRDLDDGGWLDMPPHVARQVGTLLAEVKRLRRRENAGRELADAAAALIAECATRTVAHQSVSTRDLTGWPRLESAVREWKAEQ